MVKILVCMPTKNEKEGIRWMIEKVKELNLDFIICDEQSDDGTSEIALEESIPIYQRDGKGKGFGIIKALEIASKGGYEFLVLIDCDCSYLPEDIPKLLSFLPDHDMIMGVRGMSCIQFSHRLVNILHTTLINLLFRAKLKDINTGLRVLKVDRFLGLIDAEGFDIEAQMTTRALKNKFRIKETPINYGKRKGRSKIRAFDTFVILKTIIKERFCFKR